MILIHPVDGSLSINRWFGLLPCTVSPQFSWLILVYPMKPPNIFPPVSQSQHQFSQGRCHPDQTPGPPAAVGPPPRARCWRRRTRGTWTRPARRGSGGAPPGWGVALGCPFAASWRPKNVAGPWGPITHRLQMYAIDGNTINVFQMLPYMYPMGNEWAKLVNVTML